MENQITIKKDIVIKGIRHSDGLPTYVKFSPTTNGRFIKYKEDIVLVSLDIINFKETRHTNSIIINKNIISTVEHVFSAVNGLGIDNIIIEFGSDEPPFFSDSKYVTKKLSNHLHKIKGKFKKYIEIDQEIIIEGDEGSHCKMSPSDKFIVDCIVDFPNIIGKQRYVYIDDPVSYYKKVSFCRSFFINEVKDLSNPFADNQKHLETFPGVLNEKIHKGPFISFTKEKYITRLKDPLEPAKHKVLDFIGDIFFLNYKPKIKFELYKPGHAFTRKIVKVLDKVGKCR